jgi:predicted nucleic acid-binding protein
MIAYLYDEQGADTVEEVLDSRQEVLAPFMAIMEVRYKLIRDFGVDRGSRFLDVLSGWPMRVVESTPDWGQAAADVKVPGNVSVADAWVAALALLEDATLVHRDPEFDAFTDLKVVRLPYKPRGARS